MRKVFIFQERDNTLSTKSKGLNFGNIQNTVSENTEIMDNQNQSFQAQKQCSERTCVLYDRNCRSEQNALSALEL